MTAPTLLVSCHTWVQTWICCSLLLIIRCQLAVMQTLLCCDHVSILMLSWRESQSCLPGFGLFLLQLPSKEHVSVPVSISAAVRSRGSFANEFRVSVFLTFLIPLADTLTS